MPRIMMPRMGANTNCWIDLVTGTICFPKAVMARLGWQIGQRIQVSYLKGTLVLLFAVDETGDSGYTLHYLNRNGSGGSGGKIHCARLARTVLRPRVANLTLNDLEPTYPEHDTADLALFIEEPAWGPIDFNMASTQAIPPDLLGVYDILGTNDSLKIGQGMVRDRLREHLKNEPMVQASRSARYFRAIDKEEAVLLEHLLLCQFEERQGSLPTFNRIKA